MPTAQIIAQFVKMARNARRQARDPSTPWTLATIRRIQAGLYLAKARELVA
jgi:hypothetical protein